MKTKTTYLLTGVLIVLLIAALTGSALAANGWTVKVYPIQVMVNGEVFQPKDAAGNDVPIFTLDGTTYCPLRALADAYGLEVGYDAKNHIATVNAVQRQVIRTPDPTAKDLSYQWCVEDSGETGLDGERVCTASYAGPLNAAAFREWWSSFSDREIQFHAERLAGEITEPGGSVVIQFSYGPYCLGTVYSDHGEQRSDFSTANLWIR